MTGWLVLLYVILGVGTAALARMDGKSVLVSLLYGIFWPPPLIRRFWDPPIGWKGRDVRRR